MIAEAPAAIIAEGDGSAELMASGAEDTPA
jgi:hypothetical protein